MAARDFQGAAGTSFGALINLSSAPPTKSARSHKQTPWLKQQLFM